MKIFEEPKKAKYQQLEIPTGDWLLSSAKQYVRDHLREGIDCPCCNQRAKTYKRKLNSAMAVCLIEMYHQVIDAPGSYVHIKDMMKASQRFTLNMNGGNFATMHYWSLIFEMAKDPEVTEKRTTGNWRITQKGIDFVEGRLTVPKYVFTYNMHLEGLSPEQISIKEALSSKFNYTELMKS